MTPLAFALCVGVLIGTVYAFERVACWRLRVHRRRERLRMAAPDEVTRAATPRGRL